MEKKNHMLSNVKRGALKCVLALALCLALAVGLVPAALGEGECRIDVVFPAQPEGDATLALYHVGVERDGGFYLLSQFQSVELWEDMTADDLRLAAQKMEGLAKQEPLLKTTAPVTDGKATFDGLEPGVYLVALESGPASLGFETMLLIVKESGIVKAKTMEAVKAEVTKVWQDQDDSVRPASIPVTLYADGEPYKDADNRAVTATLTAPDWYASADNLPRFRADGGSVTAVRYEWREDQVPAGYQQAETSPATTQRDSVFSTIITNKQITVDVSVLKEWVDGDYIKRPASIVVTLNKNGAALQTVELTAQGGWTATVSGLPAYYYNEKTGQVELVDYSWSEDEESLKALGYALSGYKAETDTADGVPVSVSVVLTNEYPSETSATVRKVWDDADNQDGKRPASLTVTLLRNGEEFGQTVELSEETGWSATVTGLASLDGDGKPYEYTWREPENADYPIVSSSTSGSVTTITNTHKPETTQTTVLKIWDDDNNRDGKRPKEIIVLLSTGDEYRLNEANGWTVTVSGLPKYRDGKEITYTWLTERDDQKLLAKYEQGQFILNEETGVTSITNTYSPEKVRVTAVKVWDDNDNQDGKRPASVTVQLRKNGKPEGEPVALSADNLWQTAWEDLFKYEDGVEIEYDVIETGDTGDYAPSVEKTGDYAFTVTNTYSPEKTTYTVTKIWEDGNDQDGLRPRTFTVRLLKDGKPLGEPVTLSARDNSVTYTWKDLDKYEDGVKIVYSVEELKVEGYESAFDPEADTLTNTHKPETIEIPVTKAWEDNNDQDGLRPAKITVRLLAGGVPVKSAELTADNDWRYTFKDLPKKSGGENIVYTLEEPEVAGYTSSVAGDSETGFTVENTHTPEKTDISVAKTWTGDQGNETLRTSVTVQLKADGDVLESVTLSERDGWSYRWEGMPVYKAGKKIAYTLEETSAPETYQSTVTKDGMTFTVVNTFNPGQVTLSVSKSWLGSAATRPEVQVQLTADGQVRDTVTLKEGAWSHTWTGLEKYSGGRLIEYAVKEIETEGYKATVTQSQDGDSYTVSVVNTPVTSVAVTKIWRDDDNYENIRPQSVVVELLAGDTVVGSATLTDGHLTHIFEDLPTVDPENKPIAYSVREANVPQGYTVQITGGMTVGFTVTNTHEVGLGSLRIVKNVTVGGVSAVGSTTADGTYTFTVTGPRNYSATVPITVVGGRSGVATLTGLRPGVYTVTETVPAGMTLTSGNNIAVTVTAGNTADVPTAQFVNNATATPTPAPTPTPTPTPPTTRPPSTPSNPTPTPEPTPTPVPTTSVEGQKVWDDNGDEHSLRPTSVSLQLLADGRPVSAAPVWGSTAGDSWSYSFPGLPMYGESGRPISYTVVETPVEGYASVTAGTTIINTLIPRTPEEYTNIDGQKVWNDNGNIAGTRPAYITVHLLRDGVEIASATVTAATGWQYRFDNMPVDDGYGHVYVYTVREETAPGYYTIVDGRTIINGKIPDEPETPPEEPPRYRTPPEFDEFTEEELEDLLDLFDYDTPLFGRPLGTGDELPVYPFIFAGIGLTAVLLLVLLGRKRGRSEG